MNSHAKNHASDFDERPNIAMMSDQDVFSNKKQNDLGLRDSDFEQHDPNFAYRRRLDDSRNDNLSLYQEQMQQQQQMRGAIEYPTQKQEINKEEEEEQSRTFMGSVKNEKQSTNKKYNQDLQIVQSSASKKKQSHVATTGARNIVDMFQEDDRKKPQRNQVQVTDEESEAGARAKQRGKKKKKKRPIVTTDDDIPEYNAPQMQQQYYRQHQQRPGSQQSNFDNFTQNFYPQRVEPVMMSGRSAMNTMRSQRMNQFEPQFIQTNPMMTGRSTNRMLMPALPINQEYPDELEKWVSKPTQQGFLYFHLKGTKTYQWNFPRFFDPDLRKTRPYFVDHWIKKYDNRGKKFWQNMHSKHLQHVKPDSETYLIQASIGGNLAFIELYIKSQGNLVITDQQRRTALHHACSNGHREICAMLCEMSYPLLEAQDVNGCTPAFMAARYNEAECIKLLISYDCNIFHKMRNGDTVLHVAAAYNSLESMIILTNFGGMELCIQKNRYGLRAIDIAQKMRNYECFEALQKLERNITYQNAIIERELQSLDQVRGGTKSFRGGVPGDYLGSGPNYPQISSRRNEILPRRDNVVPNLHLSNMKQQYSSRLQQNPYQPNQDDSSILYEEPSGLDLPLETEDDQAYAFESLGGRTGYQQRMQAFEKQAKSQRHERRYIEKVKGDKTSQREDRKERRKHSNEVEFDDYRKTLKEGGGVTSSRKNLKQIQEVPSSSQSSGEDNRRVPLSKRSTVKIQPGAPESESDEARMYTARQKSARRNSEEDLPRKANDISHRNQSMFKLSIRDDNSIMHNPMHHFDQPSSRRGKSVTDRGDRFTESSSRYLQRHLAHRYEQSSDEDEETGRRPRTSRSQKQQQSAGLGDPWKVSRSRERRRADDVSPDDRHKQSFVELAYDKTAQVVSSVKGLLVSGLWKIKSYMGGQERDKSRTSRSQRRRQASEDSSLDRYKTPTGGRSKSRGFSKVMPITESEDTDDHRPRHVNFNMNRVVLQQEDYGMEVDNSRSRRAKSNAALSQRSMNNNTSRNNAQIQAEPAPNLVKSALKRNQVRESSIGAKSVGVGSHNIHEESIIQPPGPASSSNQEQLLQGPHVPMHQSINSQPISADKKPEIQTTPDTENRTGLHQTDRKRNQSLKTKQILLHKNYQSSEERGGTQAILGQENRRFIAKPTQEEEWQQLSPSSRNSSNKREIQTQAPYREPKHVELARQLAASDNGGSPLTKPALIPDPKSFQPTAASTQNKKSVSAIGSINSQKRAPLSQEQFEMIMMNSEQEGGDKKATIKYATQQKEAPNQSTIASGPNELQKLYDELMHNNSVHIEIATNLPSAPAKLDVPKGQDTLDESDLSNMYNRIMSQHQYDFKKPGQIITPKNQEEVKKVTVDPEVSLLTEFNPPTQRVWKDRSILYDMSFQSGITDIRKALEEEENFDNVSNCSFIEDAMQDGAQKINQQIAASNILDKGQFMMATQNSLHQSMGWQAGNNSQFGGGRQASLGARPTGMQMLKNQNNSMHFNPNFGNSFSCQQKYQSDTDDNQIGPNQSKLLNKNNQPLSLSRKGSVNELTPQKKAVSSLPISTAQVSSASNAPKSQNNVGVRASQSQNPCSAGQATVENNGFLGPLGSANSDNSSAVVVIKSQTSYNTRGPSLDPPHENNQIVHQQMINLFKEDVEIQNSSPQRPLRTDRTNGPVDETQTDLESGFRSSKQATKNLPETIKEEEPANTFQGLSSVTEHQVMNDQSNTISEQNTQQMKKAVMKKLIEIMDDEEDDEAQINDDQSLPQASDSDRFIEKHAEDEKPQMKIIRTESPKQGPPAEEKKIMSRQGSLSKRGNTRYGERDDSMINFDLTSSKIVDAKDIEEDPSIHISKKTSDQEMPQMSHRKSLKMQLQEQIQSIVVSESSQNTSHQVVAPKPGPKPLMTTLESELMPLVILKPAFDQPPKGESFQAPQEELSPDLETSTQKKDLKRKYDTKSMMDKKRQANISQDSILHELDSISRIYNELEIVPEESISKQSAKQMLVLPNDNEEEEFKECNNQSLEKQRGRTTVIKDSPALWGAKDQTSTKKEGSLPPLMRAQSEDEGETMRTNRIQDIFYPKDNVAPGDSTPTRRSDKDNQEEVGYLHWAREDKQNRSTANPLFNYATSSDDEGGSRPRKSSQQKMARLLNKYQLHSSVIGVSGAPLYQQSPSTMKNSQQQTQAVTPFQPQKSIRDVSFKSHNVSAHTDNSERLKENLKMFGKNRLLSSKK